MNRKLTLSIDQTVIEKAKEYARKSGRSLSDLVESYLKSITITDDSEIPVEFQNLFGSVDLSDDWNDKAAIRDILTEKYSK